MTDNAAQIKHCPVCGEPYTDQPPFCSFCKWELFSILELGKLTPEKEKKHLQKLDDARQRFCQAALVISWRTSSFDRALFDTMTKDRQPGSLKNQQRDYEAKYRTNFLRRAQDKESPLQQGIYALAMGQQNHLFLLDDGPDQITLAHVSGNGDQLNVKFLAIPWTNLLATPPNDPDKRDLALVGGYIEVEKQRLSEGIHAGFKELGAPQSFPVVLCSRLYDGLHSKAVCEASEAEGCQNQFSPYSIGDAVGFKAYLQSLLSRAPLRQELALAVVRVAQDGRQVTLKYHTLFPAGVFLDLTQPKQVVVQSLNNESNQIDLAIVRRKGEEAAPTLHQAWKANLHYKHETQLIFRMTKRWAIEVSGTQVTPSSSSLADLLSNIPTSISINSPMLDLVLVIDTIASPDVLRQRCTLAKNILGALVEQEKADNLRLMVVAYGNYYPVVRNTPKDWPQPLRMQEWAPLVKIEEFLDGLKPTPIEDCEFESALDETLQELTQLNWREQAGRWLLLLGQRPPRPLHPTPGWYQAKSQKGYDWRTLVKTLRERIKVNNLAVVCPLEWSITEQPHHAPAYAEEFWSAFSTERLEFGNINAGEAAQKILSTEEKSGNGLSLPVVLEHRK